MFWNLLTIGLFASLVASVTAAIDAIRRSPQAWETTGHSQKLRLAIFLSPLLSFFCIPLGGGLALYYLFRIRPTFVVRESNSIDPGSSSDRHITGFAATWHELSPWHKVKVILAVILAIVMEIAVWSSPDRDHDVPAWAFIVLAPITFVAFFLVVYLGLWFAQIFLPLAWKSPDNVTPRLDRLRQAAEQERNASRAADEAQDERWRRQRRGPTGRP